MESKGGPPRVSKVEAFPAVNFSMLENLANLCGQSRVILDRVSRNGPREDGNAGKPGSHEGRCTHTREDARGAAAREAGLKPRLPR